MAEALGSDQNPFEPIKPSRPQFPEVEREGRDRGYFEAQTRCKVLVHDGHLLLEILPDGFVTNQSQP